MTASKISGSSIPGRDTEAHLAHGVALKLRRVGANPRIEIENAPAPLLDSLKAAGCFTEIIQWRTRVFAPFRTDAPDDSATVIDKVLAILPVATAAKRAARTGGAVPWRHPSICAARASWAKLL